MYFPSENDERNILLKVFRNCLKLVYKFIQIQTGINLDMIFCCLSVYIALSLQFSYLDIPQYIAKLKG